MSDEQKSENVDAREAKPAQSITIRIPEHQTGVNRKPESSLLDPSFLKKATVSATAFAAANFGTNYWLTSKLIPFDQEVARLTRDDIMKRAGAGLSNMGVGADAGGIGGHAIEEAHTLNLIRSGEHPLAEFMYKVGGRGTVALAAGAAAGVAGWALTGGFSSKENNERPQSHTERIEAKRQEVSASEGIAL